MGTLKSGHASNHVVACCELPPEPHVEVSAARVAQESIDEDALPLVYSFSFLGWFLVPPARCPFSPFFGGRVPLLK